MAGCRDRDHGGALSQQLLDSDSETQDGLPMREGEYSESGDEIEGATLNLDDDVPPTLLNLNRRRSRSVHGGDGGPAGSFNCNRTDDVDDVIVASTPPELLRRKGTERHLQATNPQVRVMRRRASTGGGGPGGFMRPDQTALPFTRPMTRAVSRRGASHSPLHGLHGSGASEAPPSGSQPCRGNGSQPERRVLGDISNISDRSPHVPASEANRRLPAKRRRKTGLWSDDQLQRAMQAVEGGMRIQTAADLYKIPASSLRDHLFGVTIGRKRGGKCVLTGEEEQLVVNWIVRLQELGHPITTAALRMKVAEICEDRETPFTGGIPGRGWLRWWRRRHPELTLRVAQGLETSRARGLSEENVRSFYENLKHLYDSNAYSPDRVWNCDETRAQAGRNGGALVLARRGVRAVHQVMPDEREWLSVLVCVNALGVAIPSFYIFRGKRFRRNYIERCESGATMAMQPRAWMTSFLFSKWISHFVKSVEPLGGVSQDRRHLLIFDGHVSHVSIDTVQEARRQGIDLITLPSHTSHAMQPLDVSLFKPFKVAFKAYRDYWTYRFAGASARKENLAQWVSLALRRALTVENIQQ